MGADNFRPDQTRPDQMVCQTPTRHSYAIHPYEKGSHRKTNNTFVHVMRFGSVCERARRVCYFSYCVGTLVTLHYLHLEACLTGTG